MPELARDEHGNLILLAEPRKRVLEDEPRADLVTPDHTSGPAEWGRYSDAVRECSRSFDNPEEGDVKFFLDSRARSPEKVDQGAFHEAVKRQRMSDLVDALDHHMRKEGSLPRGARMVRVQAPRGYLRRALKQSSPEDIAHIRHRLNSIGHESDRVDNFLSARVGDDLWAGATQLEIRAADSEFDGLFFDDSEGDDYDQTLETMTDMMEHFRPEIHIHMDAPKPE